jgi:hypothetical protein
MGKVEPYFSELEDGARKDPCFSHGDTIDTDAMDRGKVADDEVLPIKRELCMERTHGGMREPKVGLPELAYGFAIAVEHQADVATFVEEHALLHASPGNADAAVFGHEGGPPAHDRPGEGEAKPLGVEGGVGSVLDPFGEVLDASTGPGTFEPAYVRHGDREDDVELLSVGFAIDRGAREHEGAGTSAREVTEHPEGFTAVQIGEARGQEVTHARTLPPECEVGEHGACLAHAPGKACQYFRDGQAWGEMFHGSTACTGEACGKPRVGRRPHDEDEEPRTHPQEFGETTQQPPFVAHGHVGDEHHDTGAFGALWKLRREGEGVFEFRTTARRSVFECLARPCDQFGRERQETSTVAVEGCAVVVEEQHLGGIAGSESCEHGLHGLVDECFRTTHRRRPVDEHEHVSWARRSCDHVCAGSEHSAAIGTGHHGAKPRDVFDGAQIGDDPAAVATTERLQIARTTEALGVPAGQGGSEHEKESPGSSFRRSFEMNPRTNSELRCAPVEGEISVGDGDLGSEANARPSLRMRVDGHHVGGTTELVHLVDEANGDLDVRWTVLVTSSRRADRSLLRGGIEVTAGRHHGVNEAPSPVVVGEEVLIHEFDLDVRAGGDVGHREGKERGAIFFEQGSRTPLCERGFILSSRDIFLLHDAVDHPFADAEEHLVDGGLGRQRKEIHGLDGNGTVVVKTLADGDLGDGPPNDGFDGGALERECDTVGAAERSLSDGGFAALVVGEVWHVCRALHADTVPQRVPSHNRRAPRSLPAHARTETLWPAGSR